MIKRSIKKSYSEIVMRLTHSSILVSFDYQAEEFKVKPKILEWQLPKKINPNNINPEIEFLSSFLARMVKQYKMEGELVTWVIPHQKSRLKNITIPLNLRIKADKKEFDTLTKASSYDFWKEHDPDLADIKLAEIRSSLLTTNTEENTTSMLYCAVDKLTLRLYQNLSLQSNLYPIGYISEDQSLIKIIESRLSRIQRERPFAIFHLSKGNNRIIYVNSEQSEIARVNIDELDESLLDEIPIIDENNKDFWSEIMTRISTSLKVATSYLLEELKVLRFENIYFVSDYENEDSLIQLLRENYREVNLISIKDQFDYVSVQKADSESVLISSEENKQIYSGSKFIPSFGNYNLKYFSEIAIPNMIAGAAIMNFHEKGAFIKSNFINEKLINKIYILFISLILLSTLIMGGIFSLNLGNDANQQKLVQAEKKLDRLKAEIESGNAATKKMEKEHEIITQLANGQTNQKLFEKLVKEIPPDVELDRVIVRDNSFQIYGNSLNVSSLNNFYNRFIQDSNFENIKIDSYRIKDKSMNFFELVGVIKI